MSTRFTSARDAPDFIAPQDHVGFESAKMLLDIPPSKHYRITYSVIKPLGFADEHAHPWDHAYFILEGRGKIKVGSEERDVSKGSLTYVPPGEKHSVRNTQSDAPLVVLAIIGPDSEYTLR